MAIVSGACPDCGKRWRPTRLAWAPKICPRKVRPQLTRRLVVFADHHPARLRPLAPRLKLGESAWSADMYIVVDIGGTKTRVAVARDFDGFEPARIFETSQDYIEGLSRIVATARELAGDGGVRGVSLGAPGVLSRDKRKLVRAPNLPRWDGANLVADLEKALAVPVLLENDAALAGLGEAVVGAGKGAPIVAYITMSTGVNGARIVDGAVDRAAFGFEMGEQILGVEPTSPTFEWLTSGVLIEQRLGKRPGELGADHEIWDELAGLVAIALHNTIAYWSPDRIVIGGSMMNEVGISIERVRGRLLALPRKNPALPNVVRAALGDVGGLWGALMALKAQVGRAPHRWGDARA
jgi:glucokinase